MSYMTAARASSASFTLAAALVAFAANTTSAQECTAEGNAGDLDEAAVEALYACIEAQMVTQYSSEGDEVAAAYRGWQVTSTRPAAPGPHGERFLQTFANDVAAEQYLKFEEEVVAMPAGSILAKESFALRDGVAQVGPLFVMTKLEEGQAPDAGDWLYSALQPDGKPMGIQQSFCAGCHLGWDYRDSLAYPVEEVRLTGQ